ncbi:MAG: hypothetical protein ACI865_001183 [Flavobacteriaceae bacterium]|jgi:hypothetical protein
MKRILLLFQIVLFALLFSCESDDLHQAIGGELTVHYESESDEELAEKILMFWRDNDLLSGKEQDLQLVRRKGIPQLSIIAKDTANIQNMPFMEKKLFSELKLKLWKEVFRKKTFKLMISDNKFNPLYSVGE